MKCNIMKCASSATEEFHVLQLLPFSTCLMVCSYRAVQQGKYISSDTFSGDRLISEQCTLQSPRRQECAGVRAPCAMSAPCASADRAHCRHGQCVQAMLACKHTTHRNCTCCSSQTLTGCQSGTAAQDDVQQCLIGHNPTQYMDPCRNHLRPELL